MSLRLPDNEDARVLLELADRELVRAFDSHSDEELRKNVRRAIEHIESAHVTILGKSRFTDPDNDHSSTDPGLLNTEDPRLHRLWDVCAMLDGVVPGIQIRPSAADPEQVEYFELPTEGATRLLPVAIDALREVVRSLGFKSPTTQEVRDRLKLWEDRRKSYRSRP